MENATYWTIWLQCGLYLWVMKVFIHTSSPLLMTFFSDTEVTKYLKQMLPPSLMKSCFNKWLSFSSCDTSKRVFDLTMYASCQLIVFISPGSIFPPNILLWLYFTPFKKWIRPFHWTSAGRCLFQKCCLLQL